MRVLTLDTATRLGLVAAVEDGQVVACREHDRPMHHAERLFGMVDDVLQAAGWTREEVQLLAVGMGPGSFTGVRVGMAAAKGIGFSLGIPLVGVTSLASMAHAGRAILGEKPILAMLDARKGEVFAACYGSNGALLGGPEHIPRDEVRAWISRLPMDVGGLAVVGEVVAELEIGDLEWGRGRECDLPGPGSTAALAQAQWLEQRQDQIDTLEPLYVRPPDITEPSKSRGR